MKIPNLTTELTAWSEEHLYLPKGYTSRYARTTSRKPALSKRADDGWLFLLKSEAHTRGVSNFLRISPAFTTQDQLDEAAGKRHRFAWLITMEVPLSKMSDDLRLFTRMAIPTLASCYWSYRKGQENKEKFCPKFNVDMYLRSLEELFEETSC